MKQVIVILSKSVHPETISKSVQRHSVYLQMQERFYMSIFDDEQAIDMFEEIKNVLKGKKS